MTIDFEDSQPPQEEELHYSIDISKDGMYEPWYIRVHDASGSYMYNGYWTNSEDKRASEAIAEAVRGSCLDVPADVLEGGLPHSQQERLLRRLLCVAHCPGAYLDDGEASDSSVQPCIDFMRDSAELIDEKLRQRLFARIRNAQCDMGVGCETAGVCYADAHGEPERCSLATTTTVRTSRDALPPALIPVRWEYKLKTDPDVPKSWKLTSRYGYETSLGSPDLYHTRTLYAAPSPPEPCTTPPAGWTCTREAGHEGPCAALPVTQKTLQEKVDALSTRAEDHLAEHGQFTEDECFVAEHMLQLDFEMLDDNAEVFGCTLDQVLALLRARGGAVERKSESLPHDNVRDNIGQAISDVLTVWVDPDTNTCSIDAFDANTVDELANAVMMMLQKLSTTPVAYRWWEGKLGGEHQYDEQPNTHRSCDPLYLFSFPSTQNT